MSIVVRTFWPGNSYIASGLHESILRWIYPNLGRWQNSPGDSSGVFLGRNPPMKMQKAVPEEKQCVAKGHVHALVTSLLQPKIFEAKCHITWSLKTARTDAKFCAWICGWFWIKDAPIVHCLFVCFFPNFQFFLPFLMSVRKFGFF